METLLHNISQVLGVTVLHSFWQGLLVYLLLTIVYTCAPSLSSVKKHNLALTALGVLAVWFVLTIVTEVNHIQWLAKEVIGAAAGTNPAYYIPQQAITTQPDNSYFFVIKAYLPYITVAYLIGLLLNILKLCFALRNVSLVRSSLLPAVELEAAVKKFAAQMGIKKHVLVSYSRLVDVPGIVGYFKPVLLMPVAITNNLTTAEVEAILLHELSHIKRNDYLLNLLQQVMTVVLFFNPFAVLINRAINSERENCCDDEVVKITGQPLVYARALLSLEQTKQQNLQLALAATGKKYHLLNRIERIMTAKKLTVNVRHLLAAVLLFAFSAGSIAWLNPEIKGDNIKLTVVKPFFDTYFGNDTVPVIKTKNKKQYKVTRTTAKNGKQTTMINNVDDPELERLSKEVEKHGDAVGKYYESAVYKNITKEIEKNLDEQTIATENPQVKALLKRQELAAAAFDKYFENNSELQKLHAQMEKSAGELDQQYNTPQLKKLEAELNKASEKLDKLKPNTVAFNRELETIRKASAEIGRLHAAQQITAQKHNLQLISQKIQEIHQSEDFKKKQTELHAIGDSIGKVFNNAMSAKTREYNSNLNKRLHALNNSPEIVREQKQLRAASARLQAYVNSPAFKKRMNQLQVAMPAEAPDPIVVDEITGPDVALPPLPEAPAAVEAPEPAN